MAAARRGTPQRTCAVASPHAAATEAATNCVQRGGNALDAALAAAFTLTVVYPHNTSLGGDLFALVHAPNGEVTSVNASGPAARQVDASSVAARHRGRMPLRGVDTVTVPGALAGLGAAHALGARLPWGVHLGAGRDLAAAGVAVAPGLERAIDEELDLLRADPGLRAVFAPGGRPRRRGELLVQPQLARTLERIADDGPDALSRGTLARELVAWLRAQGSPLDDGDFEAYEPFRDGGVVRTVCGREVWTARPNSQGFLLLEILEALELARCDAPLGADAGVLSALFGLAIRDRDRALADPDAMGESLDGLLDVERWSALVDGIRREHPSRPGAGAPETRGSPARRASGDTVAVVAADSDGWAVSLIQSLFHSFGSGLLHEPSGIILHDRGALFSLDPRSPNVLAPGKRPAHTLMPVVVREEGRLRWVAGTMGGRAQPQIHAQVLLRLFGGADPASAVAGPRWIVESDGASEYALVEHGVRDVARDSIRGRMRLIDLPDLDETTGHAQVVGIEDLGSGALTAGSDPRADGSAATVRMAPGP